MLKQTIGFIGGGNMAQAIIGGLLSQGILPEQLWVSDPNPTICAILQEQGVSIAVSNQALVRQVDVVILAIKPQMVQHVLPELAADIQSKLVISIMAGVEIETLRYLLNGVSRVVRVMPNTPALVQQGANGVFAVGLSDEDCQLTRQILEATGVVTWVKNEQDIDVVTALSGSGPAYFFYMMEQMIQAGVALGMAEEDAKQLVLQTALGAATMALQSEDSPSRLRERVTSPHGTTHAAIETFNQHGVNQGIYQGVFAACQRSQALAKQMKEVVVAS